MEREPQPDSTFDARFERTDVEASKSNAAVEHTDDPAVFKRPLLMNYDFQSLNLSVSLFGGIMTRRDPLTGRLTS